MSTTSEEPRDESTLLVAIAERQVAALVNAALLNNRQVRTLRRTVHGLMAVVVLLVALLGVGGWFIYQERELAQSVQAGAISQCEAGNTLRQGDSETIDRLVHLLLQGTTNQADIARGREYEQFVAGVNKARDCTQVFHVSDRR